MSTFIGLVMICVGAWVFFNADKIYDWLTKR